VKRSEVPRKKATADQAHQVGHEHAHPTDQTQAQPPRIPATRVEKFIGQPCPEATGKASPRPFASGFRERQDAAANASVRRRPGRPSRC
jgi:hypothetical protein